MVRFAVFIIACALAAFAPFLAAEKRTPNEAAQNFHSFPTEFENQPLKELELTEREQIFFENFPGKVGRFSDGRREIIFRYVTEATRKLHPASDCFAAVGYKTKPLPMRIDAENNRWSCFSASKTGESLRVCERIYTADNRQNWTDVSAWYWSALSDGNGAWWAVTVAEREN